MVWYTVWYVFGQRGSAKGIPKHTKGMCCVWCGSAKGIPKHTKAYTKEIPNSTPSLIYNLFIPNKIKVVDLYIFCMVLGMTLVCVWYTFGIALVQHPNRSTLTELMCCTGEDRGAQRRRIATELRRGPFSCGSQAQNHNKNHKHKRSPGIAKKCVVVLGLD